MKLVRYVIGITLLLLGWQAAAMFIGMWVIIFFETPEPFITGHGPGERYLIGMGLKWQLLPGTVLGLCFGILLFWGTARRGNGADRRSPPDSD